MKTKLICLLKREFILAVFIAIATYSLFYSKLLITNSYLSGSDPVYYHYPNRFFLWESLQRGVFPFYTERIFSGFPLYADITSGYLNPLNILSIVLFGPFNSYKVLHFLIYLSGSIGLYKFLKNYNGGLLGYFVSNLTYYFSFFSLYHLKHFDITPAIYLLPLALYVLQKFVFTSKIKFVLLNALILAQALYFGSLQMVLLMTVCCLLYGYVYLERRMFFNYIIFFGITFIALVMPLVAPAIDLYLQSVRGDGGISYLQGSYSPLMFLNSLYPFTFGAGEQYKWAMVSKDFLIQETYVYVGVVSFMLAVIAFLKLSDLKLRKFLVLMLSLFGLLGFLGSIPFTESINIPLISMFRYWGRSSIYFVFAVSILSGYFFSNLNNKVMRLNLKYLFIGLSYFILLLLSDVLMQGHTLKIINMAFNGAIVKDLNLVAFILLLGCFVVLYFRSRNMLVICALVLLDLFIFSKSVIPSQLDSLEKIRPTINSEQYENYFGRRVLILDSSFTHNLNLYNDIYGVLGYSQMKPAIYDKLFKSLGFKNLEKYESTLDLNDQKVLHETQNSLGLEAVIDPSILLDSHRSSLVDVPFITQDAPIRISSLNYGEGFISAKIFTNQDTLVKTYIRNFSGWELQIDGTNTLINNSSQDTYISFPLISGEHSIVFKYIPRPLYIGFGISIIAGLVLIIMLIFTHEQDRIHKNGRVRKDILVAQR